MVRPALPDDLRPDPCELRSATDTRIAAARRHQRAKEPMCVPCADAWRAKNVADQARRKAAS